MTAKEAPDYFAIPDPLDESKVSYWYRPKNSATLKPWPPRRSKWGVLWSKDVPSDLRKGTPERRAFVNAHYARVAAARRTANEVIRADPARAAARFAGLAIRCAFCGKALTDERSKTYGVGPECRSGTPREVVDAIAELVREVYGEGLTRNSSEVAC